MTQIMTFLCILFSIFTFSCYDNGEPAGQAENALDQVASDFDMVCIQLEGKKNSIQEASDHLSLLTGSLAEHCYNVYKVEGSRIVNSASRELMRWCEEWETEHRGLILYLDWLMIGFNRDARRNEQCNQLPYPHMARENNNYNVVHQVATTVKERHEWQQRQQETEQGH
jgi:hypothetical protein